PTRKGISCCNSIAKREIGITRAIGKLVGQRLGVVAAVCSTGYLRSESNSVFHGNHTVNRISVNRACLVDSGVSGSESLRGVELRPSTDLGVIAFFTDTGYDHVKVGVSALSRNAVGNYSTACDIDRASGLFKKRSISSFNYDSTASDAVLYCK